MKNIKRNILYAAAVGVSVFLLFFVVTCTWIGYEVKDCCQEAQMGYDGDCVEALIALLGDEERGFRERNSAVWALGQLGDSRALPILESYYTGDIPDREPLDGTISQYELKKAINLAGGGVNLTAAFWRFNISD